MRVIRMAAGLVLLCVALMSTASGELLQNGGFESLQNWGCYSFTCKLTTDRHSGQHAVEVSGRQHWYQGPSQMITVTQDTEYNVTGYIKLLTDHGDNGQRVELEVDMLLGDDTHLYQSAAAHTGVRVADGWVYLSGTFAVPSQQIKQTRIYYQGPDPEVHFVVDDASVTQIGQLGVSWQNYSQSVIEQHRKSDIHIDVTTASGINKADVQIHVVQTKKSFPFGVAIGAERYNDPNNQAYRDFVHTHFNWAVIDNALKWRPVEPHRGQYHYQPAIDALHGLKRNGMKIRAHNIVWSVPDFIQPWVKQLSGDELRSVVKEHIEMDMNVTRGLVEHWDVNNENLHGQWFQDRLHDPDYNLELFRIAHNADPDVKLFLNDYGVVSGGSMTEAYLRQALQFKAADVGLYGMGVQCHFGHNTEPYPNAMKRRLDTLSQAGLPIWVTELDVYVDDVNKRADYLERALRAVYGHPAVDGIMLWSFDEHQWRGEQASLVHGANLELNAAGRRLLDLLENEWMTDETHVLSQSGDQFTVRGFHGDYEVHVIYQGQERANLKKTFHTGKNAQTVTVNVHT